MRIALFTDHLFPELGGIQDCVAMLARELGARGHALDIVAPRYSAQDHAAVGAIRAEIDLGSNVRVRRRASMAFPSSTNQSRLALPGIFAGGWRTARFAPDIVHLHSPYGVGIEGLALAKLLRLPLVMTNHTAIAAFAPWMPVPVGMATGYYRRFHDLADLLTAPSQSVFDEMPAGRRAPMRRVVSNPIDTGLFRAASPAERAQWRAEFALTGPTVVFAGRLGPEKNLEPLVRAMAQLSKEMPGITLALAGHGSHRTALETLVHDVAAPVRFMGTLPAARLARLFAAADVFAMPSISETQSMAMLQAMACGLPVVAAAVRALPEFITPETGVLVPADAPEGFAAALRALLQRQGGVCAAAQASVERYGIGTVVAEWEGLYSALIERQGAYGRDHERQFRRSGI